MISVPSAVAVRSSAPASVSRTASPVASAPASSSVARAGGDQHVHERRVGHGDVRAGVQASRPRASRRRWCDVDRGVDVLATRREREELVVLMSRADVALLVAGRDRRACRAGPTSAAGGRARSCSRSASEWRMPRARAHALRDAGRDHAVVALAVAVLERAVEHPRDDLHVAVRVRAEAAAGRDRRRR